MEGKFLLRARQATASGTRQGRRLSDAQKLHSACAVAGLALFLLEDAHPQAPLVHAGWHCLAAGGLAPLQTLLRDQASAQSRRRRGTRDHAAVGCPRRCRLGRQRPPALVSTSLCPVHPIRSHLSPSDPIPSSPNPPPPRSQEEQFREFTLPEREAARDQGLLVAPLVL